MRGRSGPGFNHLLWLRAAPAFALALSLPVLAQPARAQGGGPCPYGRDPVTQQCLERPPQPPSPPTLMLSSNAGTRVYLMPKGSRGCSEDELKRAQLVGTIISKQRALIRRYQDGLRPGNQSYCYVAEGYAPSRQSVRVPFSGKLEAEPVKLVPHTRMLLSWRCRQKNPYPIVPEQVSLRIVADPAGAPTGQPPTGQQSKPKGQQVAPKDSQQSPKEKNAASDEPDDKKRGELLEVALPHRQPLPPGSYRVTVSAEGFIDNQYRIKVEDIGAELSRPICLEPDAKLTLRNDNISTNKRVLPLDGLTLRVSTGGQTIWQGLAPKGGATRSIPIRSTDLLSYDVVLNDELDLKVPRGVLLVRPEGKDPQKPTTSLSLRLPSSKLDDVEDIDRDKSTDQCKDQAAYCSAEAYLRVERDKTGFQDETVQELLTAGCIPEDKASAAASDTGQTNKRAPRRNLPNEVIRSCIAMPLKPSVRTKLKKACSEQRLSDAWLACLRLQQHELNPEYFLTYDGNVPYRKKASSDPGVEAVVSLGAMMTFQERPDVLIRPTTDILTLFDWIGFGIGAYTYEIAVLPANGQSTGEGAGGASAGYKVLGGAGLEVLVILQPAPWLRVRLAGFASGYYTAIGSTAGGYGSLQFAFERNEKLWHGLTLHGGVAHFPNLVQQEDDSRQAQGGVVRPFAGLGYSLGFNLLENFN